eukprot:465853_1
MSRYRLLSRMSEEFSHHVRVVDISPTQWLLNTYQLSSINNSFGSTYFNTINSQITNGNESIIQPQLTSHQYHISLGCNTLRTFTEYITPSMINNTQKLENILQSSVYTAYNTFDKKAMTFEGIFGGIKPIEIAANIGPLLHMNNSMDKDIIYNEYKQILDILAPSFDILWIQNINNLLTLQIIMDIAKIYKDNEQIWININSKLLSDNGNELFDCLMKYNPGSIIVIGNNWKEINTNLVLVKEYTEIEGGTKFGVIINNKNINKDKYNGSKYKNIDMSNIRNNLNEMDTLWKKEVSENDIFDEWNDSVLHKASTFWIEQGVSIIGCEWENGLKIVKKQADKWNANIGM